MQYTKFNILLVMNVTADSDEADWRFSLGRHTGCGYHPPRSQLKHSMVDFTVREFLSLDHVKVVPPPKNTDMGRPSIPPSGQTIIIIILVIIMITLLTQN